MIPMPRMLLIGAATKDAGKTTLSCRIIERFRGQGIIAVKVTIHRGEDAAPHHSVTRELGDHGDKDTGRLFAAGAAAVYWVRTDERSVETAVDELFALLPPDAPILCESNTLRNFVAPGLFLFVQKAGDDGFKPSARAVVPLADRIIASTLDGTNPRYEPDIAPRLIFENGLWRIPA